MSTAYNHLLSDCAKHFCLTDVEGFVNTGQLQLDDNDITIEYLGAEGPREFLLLYTNLGRPYTITVGLLSNLLEANLFWAGTGGSTLGLDADTSEVYLSYQQRFDGLSCVDLTEILKEFSKIATYWRSFINEK